MKVTVEIIRDGISKTLLLPGGWDEITAKQWRAIVLYVGINKGGKTERQVRARIMSLLEPVVEDVKMLDGLSVISLSDICDGLAWAAKPPKQMDSHGPGWLWWKSPKKGLMNVSIQQYLLASQGLNMWAAGMKKEDAKLVREGMNIVWASGMLWRGIGWRSWLGDVSLWLSRYVSLERKLLNLYNWWGLMNWISEYYREVFDGATNDDAVKGPRALLIGLAGEKFGPLKSARRVKLHDAMTYMQMVGREAAKNKTT